MQRDGRILAGSEVTLASSPAAIGVKAGAPRPDISTAEALKRTLLAARAISYTDPKAGGASGIHFAKVIEQMGIADEVNAKNRFPPPGGLCGTLPADRRGRPRDPAGARAEAGRRHRDRRPTAHAPRTGDGVRRRASGRRARRRPRPKELIDFLRTPSGRGVPRQGPRSSATFGSRGARHWSDARPAEDYRLARATAAFSSRLAPGTERTSSMSSFTLWLMPS